MMKNIAALEKNVPKAMSMRRVRSSFASASHALFFLHFLRRLPEEEIWADRRAKNRDQRGPRAVHMRHMRHEGIVCHDRPRGTDVERSDDVRQEYERQPLQSIGDRRVSQPDRGHRDADAEHHDPDVRAQTREQLGRVGHAGEVGADVDRVGDEQCDGGGKQHRAREPVAERAGDALARHHADAGAHRLHGDHQRPGEERRPEERRPVLRTGYRVGGDARGIVVGGAGDDAGSEAPPECPKADWLRVGACPLAALGRAGIFLRTVGHASPPGRLAFTAPDSG
jgi:hypothetical protein